MPRKNPVPRTEDRRPDVRHTHKVNNNNYNNNKVNTIKASVKTHLGKSYGLHRLDWLQRTQTFDSSGWWCTMLDTDKLWDFAALAYQLIIKTLEGLQGGYSVATMSMGKSRKKSLNVSKVTS